MRRAVLVLALLVALAGVGPPAVAASPSAVVATPTGTGAADGATPARGSSASALPAGGAVPAPSNLPVRAAPGAVRPTVRSAGTEIVVQLRPNRDARWSVTMRYTLETANETAAFRRFARSFVAGEADTSLDAALFSRFADEASAASGRSMSVVNVSRARTLDNGTGSLTLSFTWTNFLERTGESELRLGDSFRTTDGGTWLLTLGPGQRVVFRTPPGYTVNTTGSQFRFLNNSVVIDGPEAFDTADELVITYRRTRDPAPDGPAIPWTYVGAGIVAVIVLAGAVLLRRRTPTPDDGEPEVGAEAGSLPDSSAEGDDTPGGADVETEEATGADADADEEEPVDLSLLSDEERVERLLRQNGGRMKQANIVRETGWSDAKVSQLLSSMSDEGRVEKLRLGRENLISLADGEGDDGDDGNDGDDRNGRDGGFAE